MNTSTKITDREIAELKVKFKGKGRIFALGLEYLNDKLFFVNKQFDNKNFCVVAVSDSRKSESVLGLFKTRKAAKEFGADLGLEEITAPI